MEAGGSGWTRGVGHCLGHMDKTHRRKETADTKKNEQMKEGGRWPQARQAAGVSCLGSQLVLGLHGVRTSKLRREGLNMVEMAGHKLETAIF